MTTKERAGKWLWDNGLAGSRSVWAHEKDRDALAALLDEVRREAVEEAARVVDQADEQYIDAESLARRVRDLAR